jgi:hypothetical protein
MREKFLFKLPLVITTFVGREKFVSMKNAKSHLSKKLAYYMIMILGLIIDIRFLANVPYSL